MLIHTSKYVLPPLNNPLTHMCLSRKPDLKLLKTASIVDYVQQQRPLLADEDAKYSLRSHAFCEGRVAGCGAGKCSLIGLEGGRRRMMWCM